MKRQTANSNPGKPVWVIGFIGKGILPELLPSSREGGLFSCPKGHLSETYRHRVRARVRVSVRFRVKFGNMHDSISDK